VAPRKDGNWEERERRDKGGGGRGKQGRIWMGEERRREGEKGKRRGSFAPIAVFKSQRPCGRSVDKRWA